MLINKDENNHAKTSFCLLPAITYITRLLKV